MVDATANTSQNQQQHTHVVYPGTYPVWYLYSSYCCEVSARNSGSWYIPGTFVHSSSHETDHDLISRTPIGGCLPSGLFSSRSLFMNNRIIVLSGT